MPSVDLTRTQRIFVVTLIYDPPWRVRKLKTANGTRIIKTPLNVMDTGLTQAYQNIAFGAMELMGTAGVLAGETNKAVGVVSELHPRYDANGDQAVQSCFRQMYDLCDGDGSNLFLRSIALFCDQEGAFAVTAADQTQIVSDTLRTFTPSAPVPTTIFSEMPFKTLSVHNLRSWEGLKARYIAARERDARLGTFLSRLFVRRFRRPISSGPQCCRGSSVFTVRKCDPLANAFLLTLTCGSPKCLPIAGHFPLEALSLKPLEVGTSIFYRGHRDAKIFRLPPQELT